MNKKNLLALALLVSPLLAQAAATQGQLTFSWTGTIPAADVVPGDIQFTDSVGGTFTPTPVVLSATVNKSDSNSLNLVTTAPVTFQVRPKTTGYTMNSVNAYLASAPTASGLTGSQPTLKTTLAAPENGEVIVVLNGQAMNTGSNNAVQVTGGSGTEKDVSLALYAKIASGSYTPGGSVSFSTPVIFSVDLTASSAS